MAEEIARDLANVHKHARAEHVVVEATAGEQWLVVVVTDDGLGGADDQGSGLRGLADRVEALDGRLSVVSPPGGGTGSFSCRDTSRFGNRETPAADDVRVSAIVRSRLPHRRRKQA